MSIFQSTTDEHNKIEPLQKEPRAYLWSRDGCRYENCPDIRRVSNAFRSLICVMLCLTIGCLTISFVPETLLTVIADTADLIVNTAFFAFCCAMFLSWCFRQAEPAFAADVNIEVPPNFTQDELDYLTATMLTAEDHFEERSSGRAWWFLLFCILCFRCCRIGWGWADT